MRIPFGPVVLWLLATVASIAVAAAAITQVGRAVVLDAPIDDRLAAVAAPEATPPDDPARQVPPASGDQDDSGDGEPGTGDGTRTEDDTDDEPDTGDDPGSGDATTGDAPGDAASESVTNTYDSIGGSAAIVVTGATVDVGWATPRAGFRVDVERAPDGHELRVEFRSDEHRSRIMVSVEHGELRERIEEDDRS
jgi:hypothetical protein